MKTQTIRTFWPLGLALGLILLAVPEVDARGGRGGGGHGGGHAMRAPHVSSANRAFKMPSYKPPKMPRSPAPARNNATRAHANNAQAHANNAQTRANHANNAQTHANNAQTRANNAQTRGNTSLASRSTTTGGLTGTGTTGAIGTSRTGSTATNTQASPYNYTYGTGANARRYRAYGYGSGYRNRYYGNRYGYGRSQGSNRAVVARLRSAHSSLARIDHDYSGHRVRAMHQISMAIRQLSHRSMIYGSGGFAGAGRMNNMAMNRRQGNGNLGANGRRNQRMPQAQSDSRMSQALRTLQGVNMQLSSQGSNTSGHARARGHVQYAMHEINTALSIR